MANYKKAAPTSKSSKRALSFGRRDMSATGRKEEMQPMWWKGSQYERVVTSEDDVLEAASTSENHSKYPTKDANPA